MTILVTGARGNIGHRIVAHLAAAGHHVRATARDTSTLDVPDGVETTELDLTDPARGALKDVTTVFLYPTFGDITGFLNAAGAAEIEHLVLLSSPAAYEPVEHAGRIGAAHQAIETAVRDSGLPHTVLYPSWLATNTIRDWRDQIRTGRIAIAHPDWQINPIHLDDIAEAATDLLTRDRFRGRSLILTGPASLSQREVIAVLAEELGHSIEVEELSREEALATRPDWFPEAAFASLLDVAEASAGIPATVNNNVERITGHPARPFAEWMRSERNSFGV